MHTRITWQDMTLRYGALRYITLHCNTCRHTHRIPQGVLKESRGSSRKKRWLIYVSHHDSIGHDEVRVFSSGGSGNSKTATPTYTREGSLATRYISLRILLQRHHVFWGIIDDIVHMNPYLLNYKYSWGNLQWWEMGSLQSLLMVLLLCQKRCSHRTTAT